jgi:hypothetical protein
MAASTRLQKELEIKSRHILATTKDPLKRLRAACLARGAQGIKGLSMYVFFFSIQNISSLMKEISFCYLLFSLFRIMDDDRDRKLSLDEFRKGVEEYGLNFSKSEIDELFSLIDIDHNGNIDYEEFLRKLRVYIYLLFLNFISIN